MNSVNDIRNLVLFQAACGTKPKFRCHLRWSDDESEVLVSMRSAGFAFKEISRALPGRTPVACRDQLDRLLAKGEA